VFREAQKVRLSHSRLLVADLRNRLNSHTVPLAPLPIGVWDAILERPRLVAAAVFIHEHRSEPVTLSQIGAAMHMERTSACRYFSQHAGLRAGEFVRKYKMCMALVFLRSTEMQVGEIASDLGFESMSAFCRSFKSQIGLTPLEYRRTFRALSFANAYEAEDAMGA
jgi:AraC-like DNA-binding protein